METRDYYHMGLMVKRAAHKNGGGCFAVLEGGYNHSVLGYNVAALINGMAEPVE
jgi:acetoin utilization deacetylase AcuC-like enzyme